MERIKAAFENRLAIYRAKRDQAAASTRPLEEQMNYTREDMFQHSVEAIELLAFEAGIVLDEEPDSDQAS